MDEVLTEDVLNVNLESSTLGNILKQDPEMFSGIAEVTITEPKELKQWALCEDAYELVKDVKNYLEGQGGPLPAEEAHFVKRCNSLLNLLS